MNKIILNPEYDESVATPDQKGKYQFVDENGSKTDLVVWNEKSKTTEKHPEGKPWIKLPKNNPTNRAFYSEDLFIAENVNGEVEVEVKTSAPRVIGTSGVKQDIIKYLDDTTAEEYTTMVNKAVEAYKAAKASSRKKKPEEMSVEELQAYIDALKNGTPVTTAKTGPKSFIDMFTEEEYNRYNEIIALAQENKANAPKAKRGPLTDAEKEARAAKRKANELSKAEKLLAALMAGGTSEETSDEDEDIDDDELLDF